MWTPVSSDGLCGWVGSVEEAEKIRNVYEAENSITFVSGKKEANFGRPFTGKYRCINYNASIGDIVFITNYQGN
jgi:hypothetical protein